MPSLHVGWVLLVSIAIMNLVRRAAVRATAALLPVAMFAAIVLTGNHYVVDGIAGGVVVLLGLAIARAWRRRHAVALSRAPQPRRHGTRQVPTGPPPGRMS